MATEPGPGGWGHDVCKQQPAADFQTPVPTDIQQRGVEIRTYYSSATYFDEYRIFFNGRQWS